MIFIFIFIFGIFFLLAARLGNPRKLSLSVVWFVAFAILLSSAALVFAGNTASVSGTVSDPTGAVIPRASVTLTAQASASSLSAVSRDDGRYSFAGLSAGRYQISVTAQGFHRFLQNTLEIAEGSAVTADAQLAMDSDLQSVSVVIEGAQIETSSTQMGELLSGKEMTVVPVNGRGYTDLLALQAGVVPTSSQQPNAVMMSGCTHTSPSGDLNAGNFSVSGQRETSNGFLVNGGEVEEDFNMGTAIIPNLDSIQDLHVLTSNVDAQYGNFSGGQVVLTTKSGSNQFHGSVFEFLRNTNLDARNDFSTSRAKYDQNQYGATLGGPIRKDKIFFFADYQGTGMSQGVDTGLITVPTLADRSGNVLDLASSLNGIVNGQSLAGMLSQKLGYTVSVGEPYYLGSCNSTAQCVFPGAKIPQSAWSPPASHLLQYIPTPTQGLNQFSTSAEEEKLTDNKGAIRLDANTRLGMFSAYYFDDDYSTDDPYPTAQAGANVPGFNAITHGRARLLSLGLTKTIGDNIVNEFHFSYLRDANNVGQPVGGVGPNLVSQGFVTNSGGPSIVALSPQIEGVENVAFNDFTIGVDTTGLVSANNTFQWSDDFSKVIGKHTLKLGGGFHFDQININPDAIYNGSFSFTGSATGSDFADFLLGLPSNYSQGDSHRFYLRNKYLGLYAQDSWRVTSNLTLNYGLRWDMLPAWREKYNQLQTLSLGEQSVVYPGAPQGLVFPGDPGIPTTLAPTKHANFAPRLGLAYSPDFENGWLHSIFGPTGSTSVRAGYGMFYTAFEGLSAGIMSANPPYGYDYTSLAPPLFNDPFVNAATGKGVLQPFPSPIPAYGASASRPNASIDWSQYEPVTGVPSFYRGNVPPYTESYNVAIERQLGQSMFLSASYVGSQTHHQLVLISANPGNPETCLSVSRPSQVMAGTATCGPFGEGGTYTTTSGETIQGTRGPYSSLFDAITYQKTIGNADYNSLQVNLRRQSRNLELLVGYTYGKSIDQSSSLAEAVNPIDPAASKAISAFDMRHNFVASYNYNLPIDTLLRRQNRWTQGWSLSGITRFTSGLPVTLYNNTDSSLLGSIPNGINNDGVDTLSVASGNLRINTNPRNGAAFNTALFSVPALGEMGNVPRRFFYGPGIENFDMALLKNLSLSESKSLQFRMEAFNVFNHTQFYGAAAVNGNISSSSFGQVVSSAPPRLVQLGVKFMF